MFERNPNLRGKGEAHDYTPEQIKEYMRCAEDIVYFGEKYFTIVTLDNGKQPIKLWDFQKKILKVFTDPPEPDKLNTLILLPRQFGKCVFSQSDITIRNKKTGEVSTIAIGDFYDSLENT